MVQYLHLLKFAVGHKPINNYSSTQLNKIDINAVEYICLLKFQIFAKFFFNCIIFQKKMNPFSVMGRSVIYKTIIT